jgi:terminase large subunit-like protein
LLTIPEQAVRFTLHSQQADVWKSAKRFKVVVSGRRWGKTRLALMWLLVKALKGEPGKYWYVGPTRDDAKDVAWGVLKQLCDPSWLAGPVREGDLALDLVTGAEIRIYSAEKNNSLRGRALRALVMDEYADMAREVFHEVLLPALADYGAPALFIGTPKAYNHFHELFLRGQPGAKYDAEWDSWQFQSLANVFLPALSEMIENSRRTMDPRSFRQEWEASFEALSGRVYYAFKRQVHMKSVTLEPTLPVCVAFDFNVNPCTAVIGQPFRDECRVWREVFLKDYGGEATSATALKAKQLLREAGWRGAVRLYGDASGKAAKTTGPSDHAAIQASFPGSSFYVPAANPHVKDRIKAVNARCETTDGKSHMVIDPSCTHLISDLEQVIFAENGELDKKSNPMLTHISDALGYWVHQDWPPVSTTSAAVAHVGWL